MVTLLAFITMLIDHTGLIFFPHDEIWRIIGRIAFPLFAWGIVRGYRYTSNKERYAKRIFFLAVISQIPVLILFGDQIYNVCFTLLFGLISLFIYDQKEIHILLKIILWGSLGMMAYAFHFDYGVYGILTILLLHIFWQQKKSVIYFALLTFFFYCIDFVTYTIHFSLQMYSVFSLIILYFTPIQKYDFKMNFYIKYGFYPIHLAILYLIYLYLQM